MDGAIIEEEAPRETQARVHVGTEAEIKLVLHVTMEISTSYFGVTPRALWGAYEETEVDKERRLCPEEIATCILSSKPCSSNVKVP